MMANLNAVIGVMYANHGESMETILSGEILKGTKLFQCIVGEKNLVTNSHTSVNYNNNDCGLTKNPQSSWARGRWDARG
jgi:hypothetical protein